MLERGAYLLTDVVVATSFIHRECIFACGKQFDRMGEKMFESESDPIPLRPIVSRWLVVSVTIGVVAASLLFIGTVTNLFMRGDIGSLPRDERRFFRGLSRLAFVSLHNQRQASVHLLKSFLKFMWQYSLGEYAVTAVTILNAETDTVIPEIKKLLRLKEIRVPLLSEAEAEAIETRIPNVVIKRSYR